MATLLQTWSTYWFGTNNSTWNGDVDARGRIRAYLESQDVGSNSSYIRLDHYIVTKSWDNYYGVGYEVTSKYRANQGSSGGSYQSVSKTGIGNPNPDTDVERFINSTYHTVYHNSDGTGRLYVNGSISGLVYSTQGDPVISVTRASAFNIALPKIPRASTISDSISTIEIGQNYALTIGSKAVSSYTLKLYYRLNSGSEVLIDDDVSAGTYNYTIPLALINSLPSATSGTLQAILKTYSGATLIGSNSISISATVPTSYVPTCSLAIDDTNAIATGWGIWVKGQSRVHGIITASGVNGSTITSYTTTGNSSTYTTAEFTTGLLTTAGSQNIVSTAKDSRNRTASDTKTISVVDYEAPTIISAEVKRCLEDGTLNNEGTFGKVVCQYSISPCSNNNAKSLTVTQGATTLTFTLTDYAGTYTAESDELFDTLSASLTYDFTFKLKDSFNTAGVEQVYTMPTALVTMSCLAGGNGVAFGKVAEIENTVEFDFDVKTNGAISVFPVGAIYLSVVNTNPTTYFGGTWVSIGAGRVLVGVDTEQTEFDTIEKTGGAKTHVLTANQSGIRDHRHEIRGGKGAVLGGFDDSFARSVSTGDGGFRTGGPKSMTSTLGVNGYASADITENAVESHNNLQPYITCYMWKRTE